MSGRRSEPPEREGIFWDTEETEVAGLKIKSCVSDDIEYQTIGWVI